MGRMLVLVLLAGLLGCTGERAAHSGSWTERLRLFQANNDQDVLELGPPRQKTAFQLYQEESATPVELEQAACSLLVVPSLDEEGRTRLTCTPQIRHAGKGLMPWRPRADRSGWTLQMQQPTEAYA